MYRSTVRPGVPGIPRCCYGVPYGWHGMNMKVEPTISAQKNPGLPLRAAAVRLLGGVGGWGVGALRELAATTNKSLPRQQPRGPSAERARGGGWRACVRNRFDERSAFAATIVGSHGVCQGRAAQDARTRRTQGQRAVCTDETYSKTS
jgi:hypothetical protein